MSDLEVRRAAFEWLRSLEGQFGETLPRTLLARGFEWRGARVPVVGPQGIFKPAVCELPLSITTTVHGPYDDHYAPDGLLRYSYRGTDPNHRDNVGLRTAMQRRTPLIYFHAVVPGKYLVTWPVLILLDHREQLSFSVAVDDANLFLERGAAETANYWIREDEGASRRAYLTAQVRVRLHQRSFRERVLEAYREQCAFCRLKHQELLDAAHIIPDSDPMGEPSVSNGLALCKLHHAAFDSHFIGLRPDYILEVRRDILEEPDGPLHLHGLKAMQGQRIILPHDMLKRPDPALLEIRYEKFAAVR